VPVTLIVDNGHGIFTALHRKQMQSFKEKKVSATPRKSHNRNAERYHRRGVLPGLMVRKLGSKGRYVTHPGQTHGCWSVSVRH
jgi:hypothetical protein